MYCRTSLPSSIAFIFCLANWIANSFAAPPDELAPWRNAKISPVVPGAERHVIHAYFNTCPESPDGRYVLYYTSATPEGESGDLRIRERATGTETIIATDITTEDAHRVACQQWSNNGRTVVYHDVRDGQWQVIAVDIATKKARVLARDRQLAFGAPTGPWVPLYGCHWNPGEHRDIELANVETGEIKTVVKAADVVAQYGDWIEKRFGSREISLFFPIVSPDQKRLFFKLSKPSGGDNFRSKAASVRDGKVVYDLEQGKFLRLIEKWGHPSWTPDSQKIFEYGNFDLDVVTGKSQRYAPSCISDHPSVAPNGKIFVTDADVTKRMLGKPGDWAVAIGSLSKDDFVLLHVFANGAGAKTWRHNHPHPAFSADGKRVYFNTNSGKWTTLMVAECAAE
jgi:hypothetical protein